LVRHALLISQAEGAFAIFNKEATEDLTMTVWTIWVLMAVATVALMVLSEHMARARGRSVRAWVWIAAITGPLPLAPLLLCALGARASLAS
jgi:FtsH-binding integral membrane protein